MSVREFVLEQLGKRGIFNKFPKWLPQEFFETLLSTLRIIIPDEELTKVGLNKSDVNRDFNGGKYTLMGAIKARRDEITNAIRIKREVDRLLGMEEYKIDYSKVDPLNKFQIGEVMKEIKQLHKDFDPTVDFKVNKQNNLRFDMYGFHKDFEKRKNDYVEKEVEKIDKILFDKKVKYNMKLKLSKMLDFFSEDNIWEKDKKTMKLDEKIKVLFTLYDELKKKGINIKEENELAKKRKKLIVGRALEMIKFYFFPGFENQYINFVDPKYVPAELIPPIYEGYDEKGKRILEHNDLKDLNNNVELVLEKLRKMHKVPLKFLYDINQIANKKNYVQRQKEHYTSYVNHFTKMKTEMVNLKKKANEHIALIKVVKKLTVEQENEIEKYEVEEQKNIDLFNNKLKKTTRKFIGASIEFSNNRIKFYKDLYEKFKDDYSYYSKNVLDTFFNGFKVITGGISYYWDEFMEKLEYIITKSNAKMLIQIEFDIFGSNFVLLKLLNSFLDTQKVVIKADSYLPIASLFYYLAGISADEIKVFKFNYQNEEYKKFEKLYLGSQTYVSTFKQEIKLYEFEEFKRVQKYVTIQKVKDITKVSLLYADLTGDDQEIRKIEKEIEDEKEAQIKLKNVAKIDIEILKKEIEELKKKKKKTTDKQKELEERQKDLKTSNKDLAKIQRMLKDSKKFLDTVSFVVKTPVYNLIEAYKGTEAIGPIMESFKNFNVQAKIEPVSLQVETPVKEQEPVEKKSEQITDLLYNDENEEPSMDDFMQQKISTSNEDDLDDL